MRRTRVRARRLVTLSVAGALVVALTGGAAGAGRGSGSPSGRAPRDAAGAARTYVVRPGDTVWAIAARISDPASDPRPVVDAILEANGLRPGDLVPGQRIVLPSRG